MNFQWSLVILLISYFTFLVAQDSVYDVDIGTTVHLDCKPSSNVRHIPTTYHWFGPQNQPLGSNIKLIIPNFSHENQGMYTCKATQIIEGRPASSEKSIFVRLKGSTDGRNNLIEVTVPQTYDAFSSGILFLLCKAGKQNGNQYRYEWITPKGVKHSTPSFFKNHVDPSDAGRYVCKITRVSDGVSSEGYTTVRIHELPIKMDKVSGTVALGQSVSLKCDVDKAKTDNKVFTQFSYSWEDPQNRVISNNQDVHITLDDPSKFGIYQCKISAAFMNPPYRQSKSIEIRYVQDSRNVGGRNADGRNVITRLEGGREDNGGFGGRNSGRQIVTTYTGSFSSNPTILRYFESLELICNISPALADVKYQITFGQRVLTTTNRYYIPQLGKENLGIYQCNINGKDPQTMQTVNLRSTFTIQPDFQSGSKIELSEPPGPQIFVRNGDKRELHCEIPVNSGLQGRDAVWYFNSKELTENDFERYNIQVLPRLYVSIVVLKNIQSSNEGKYECKVRGETKEAYILVMSKTKHIEVSPAESTRRVGDNNPVEFHCRIDGYPSKNRDIIWTFRNKDGQTTSLSGRWKRIDDQTADETSFIVISQAEEQDAGTYICTEPQTRDTAQGILHVISDLRIVVTPPIIRLRAGQTAHFECYTLNSGRSPEYPEFFQANGGRAADSQRTTVERIEAGKVRLTFRAVTINDNGTRFNCRQGRSVAEAIVLVSPICAAGFRLCRNAECINSAKFCDGKQDCSDGSDEDQQFCRQCDPLSKQCEVHNGQAPNNQIYQAHWSCDGEDDCGNGFDESNCFGNVLECGGLTYRCSDGTKTIPKAFLCDKDSDCANGDDESRCVVPTIIPEQPMSYQINARRGETVEMTCQVTGYPLPKIIWRFNWGCLTDPSRMKVTESYQNCGTTISILRISNFQPGDDGIYNCEGLAGGKRAWSKDYQLMMNFRN